MFKNLNFPVLYHFLKAIAWHFQNQNLPWGLFAGKSSNVWVGGTEGYILTILQREKSQKSKFRPQRADVPGTYQVGLVVNDGWGDSTMAVARVTARFHPVLPPAGATLQRLENDLIFYKEYVNRLAWSANPEDHAALAAIRIYRKPKGAADAVYALLASLPPSASGYDDRGLAVAQLFTYRIVAVNTRGVESEPVEVGN